MSVALYSHKPKKFRFLQAINGLQMWRAGASNKVHVPAVHVSVTRRNMQRHVFADDAAYLLIRKHACYNSK